MTDGGARRAGEPLRAEADLLDLQAAGQRQEHDVGLLRHFRKRLRAARLGPIQCGERGRVHVEGDDLTAVLERHVAAHGAAHDPQADEADHGNSSFRHGVAPLQSIHMPPLISSDVPVIQLEAGEHRNSAACAMSSALP